MSDVEDRPIAEIPALRLELALERMERAKAELEVCRLLVEFEKLNLVRGLGTGVVVRDIQLADRLAKVEVAE